MLLAALLVLEREVVQPAGRRLLVVVLERGRLAGGPRVGRCGVRVLAEHDRFLGGDPGCLEDSPSAVGSGAQAGRLARGVGEGREDVGRVVELDQLGGGSR